MLNIEKKIESELRRLGGLLFEDCRELVGWKEKRGFYKDPHSYHMLGQEWMDFLPGQHINTRDITVFLKNQAVLDEGLKEKAVVLLLKVGGEGCISINGIPYNGLDANRNMVLLTESAAGNEVYDIEIETYCKDMILNSDNVFKTDVVVTQSQLAVINRNAWDYFYDIKTGYEFIIGCKEEFTRQRVLSLLYESLLKLDYSEKGSLEKSLITAREYYKWEITKYEDLKIPVTMHFAGHSHIDVAWHWPLKETIRKVSRTFSSMLRLMEQYEEFKFCQSMPVLYEMAKEYSPMLYDQIKKRVKEGRWETLGSMYLEPDCNLIGGESFVRQIMYGKHFFKTELDSDSKVCFLPDVFGFSAAMPQILKKADTDYFFTSKLVWNETNEFPYSIFKWKGLDGTEIIAGMLPMCTKQGMDLYNGDLSGEGVHKSLENFKNKGDGEAILYLYGYGDGGGGVTGEMLETLTRLDEVPMMPKVEIGTVQQYFENLDKDKDYPVWLGDLYFEKHRGTYTTAANNKKNNRKSEFLFRDAEIFTVFQYLENNSFLEEDLKKGWKLILLNQFHDILPGTCIKEVYEECDREYGEIREIGENIVNSNVNRILMPSEEELTVFNTLSWDRTQIVEVAAPGWKGLRKGDGTYPSQLLKQDGTIAFKAEMVPAMGYQVYYKADLLPEKEPYQKAEYWEIENGYRIHTPWLQVIVGRDGELYSVFDTKKKRELIKKGRSANRLKLLEDIPVEWGSAWETTTKRNDKPSIAATEINCCIKEHNLFYTVIETSRRIHHSRIYQDIIIYHDEPLIAFQSTVDWNEHHKILRVEFPVDIHSSTAKFDIAFGNTEYPNHATTSFDAAKFEVCGHKWGDISEEDFGAALLNDCKYGYTIQNSNIELSLLRSADSPSDSCDKGIHTFTYWLYPHEGGIKDGKVAQRGYELNVPMRISIGKAPHDACSYIHTDNSNVMIDTVKKAEEGEDIILRVFETYNTSDKVEITFDFPVEKCMETNLLEQKIQDIQITDNKIVVDFKPYEIKTFRLLL